MLEAESAVDLCTKLIDSNRLFSSSRAIAVASFAAKTNELLILLNVDFDLPDECGTSRSVAPSLYSMFISIQCSG